MNRRDLLRVAGAASALSILPRSAEAATAWARIAAGYRPAAGLTGPQRALVSAIADVILPRTDTPGATDVGVPDWVDLIVSEYYADDVRASFLAGLDAIDAQARTAKGRALAELDAAAQVEMVASLDGPAARDEATRAARAAYRRLKGLVVHGYFTSQRVERDVLHVRMAYPKFEGAADFAPRPAR